MPLVEIKDFNALIDNKPIFDQPIKKKQEVYEKSNVSKRNYYTTGNLLEYLHHQNYYRLIGIDLPRQTNTSIPQYVNFVWKLDEDGSIIFCIAESNKKTILKFSLNLLVVTKWYNKGTSKNIEFIEWSKRF